MTDSGRTRRASGPAAAAQGADAETARAEESAAQVLQQFRVVLNTVKSHFQQVERATGIGGAQVWALSVIESRPGIGVGELARALSVRQPTASIVVKNLTQQGLIEARREATDRRAVQLHVLPRGRELLRRAPRPFSGLLPKALESLDADTLQRLQADLARLIGLMDADLRTGATPLGRL